MSKSIKDSAVAFPSLLHLFVDFAFFALLGAAAVIDVRTLRIPNEICLSILILYPAHVLTGGGAITWLPAGLALAVFVAGFVPFGLRWMGGGDVKLMAVVALWAGPPLIVDFLVLTALVGGVFAVAMLAPSRFVLATALDAVGADRLRDAVLGRSIPYAVAIAIGAAGSLGPALLHGVG
ncbi:MAG: prepilin peptidase [Rhodospirillales bacterium]